MPSPLSFPLLRPFPLLLSSLTLARISATTDNSIDQHSQADDLAVVREEYETKHKHLFPTFEDFLAALDDIQKEGEEKRRIEELEIAEKERKEKGKGRKKKIKNNKTEKRKKKDGGKVQDQKKSKQKKNKGSKTNKNSRNETSKEKTTGEECSGRDENKRACSSKATHGEEVPYESIWGDDIPEGRWVQDGQNKSKSQTRDKNRVQRRQNKSHEKGRNLSGHAGGGDRGGHWDEWGRGAEVTENGEVKNAENADHERNWSGERDEKVEVYKEVVVPEAEDQHTQTEWLQESENENAVQTSNSPKNLNLNFPFHRGPPLSHQFELIIDRITTDSGMLGFESPKDDPGFATRWVKFHLQDMLRKHKGKDRGNKSRDGDHNSNDESSANHKSNDESTTGNDNIYPWSIYMIENDDGSFRHDPRLKSGKDGEVGTADHDDGGVKSVYPPTPLQHCDCVRFLGDNQDLHEQHKKTGGLTMTHISFWKSFKEKFRKFRDVVRKNFTPQVAEAINLAWNLSELKKGLQTEREEREESKEESDANNHSIDANNSMSFQSSRTSQREDYPSPDDILLDERVDIPTYPLFMDHVGRGFRVKTENDLLGGLHRQLKIRKLRERAAEVFERVTEDVNKASLSETQMSWTEPTEEISRQQDSEEMSPSPWHPTSQKKDIYNLTPTYIQSVQEIQGAYQDVLLFSEPRFNDWNNAMVDLLNRRNNSPFYWRAYNMCQLILTEYSAGELEVKLLENRAHVSTDFINGKVLEKGVETDFRDEAAKQSGAAPSMRDLYEGKIILTQKAVVGIMAVISRFQMARILAGKTVELNNYWRRYRERYATDGGREWVAGQTTDASSNRESSNTNNESDSHSAPSPPPLSDSFLSGFEELFFCPFGYLAIRYIFLLWDKQEFANTSFIDGTMIFANELGFTADSEAGLYTHDYLEDSDWGINSFDLVADFTSTKDRTVYLNYENYLRLNPVGIEGWRVSKGYERKRVKAKGSEVAEEGESESDQTERESEQESSDSSIFEEQPSPEVLEGIVGLTFWGMLKNSSSNTLGLLFIRWLLAKSAAAKAHIKGNGRYSNRGEHRSQTGHSSRPGKNENSFPFAGLPASNPSTLLLPTSAAVSCPYSLEIERTRDDPLLAIGQMSQLAIQRFFWILGNVEGEIVKIDEAVQELMKSGSASNSNILSQLLGMGGSEDEHGGMNSIENAFQRKCGSLEAKEISYISELCGLNTVTLCKLDAVVELIQERFERILYPERFTKRANNSESEFSESESARSRRTSIGNKLKSPRPLRGHEEQYLLWERHFESASENYESSALVPRLIKEKQILKRKWGMITGGDHEDNLSLDSHHSLEEISAKATDFYQNIQSTFDFRLTNDFGGISVVPRFLWQGNAGGASAPGEEASVRLKWIYPGSQVGNPNDAKTPRISYKVAVIGEHGPTNQEHLYSLKAALYNADDNYPITKGKMEELEGTLEITSRHYFAYSWHMQSTSSARDIQNNFSWADFFGERVADSDMCDEESEDSEDDGDDHESVDTNTNSDGTPTWSSKRGGFFRKFPWVQREKFFARVYDQKKHTSGDMRAAGSKSGSITSEKLNKDSESNPFHHSFLSKKLKLSKNITAAIVALRIMFSTDEHFMESNVVVGCEPFFRYFGEDWTIFKLINGVVNYGGVRGWVEAESKSKNSQQKRLDSESSQPSERYSSLTTLSDWDQELRQIISSTQSQRLQSAQTHHSTVAISACSRISAEIFWHITKGRRLVYVPMLGLHASQFQEVQHRAYWDGETGIEIETSASLDGDSETSDYQRKTKSISYTSGDVYDERPIYVFRSALPFQASVSGQLFHYDELLTRISKKEDEAWENENRLNGEKMSAHLSKKPSSSRFVRRFVTTYTGESLEFSSMASRFAAIIVFPHVPNALRLSDLQSLGIPMLIPDEPYVYRVVWPLAGSYCGWSDHGVSMMQAVVPEWAAYGGCGIGGIGSGGANASGTGRLSTDTESTDTPPPPDFRDKNSTDAARFFFGDEFQQHPSYVEAVSKNKGTPVFTLSSERRGEASGDEAKFVHGSLSVDVEGMTVEEGAEDGEDGVEEGKDGDDSGGQLPEDQEPDTTGRHSSEDASQKNPPRLHPYPFFGGFQSTDSFYYYKFLKDRKYWYQLSEWKEREHVLIKFRSVRHLYDLCTNNEKYGWLFRYFAEIMKVDQAKRIQKGVKWWKGALVMQD